MLKRILIFSMTIVILLSAMGVIGYRYLQGTLPTLTTQRSISTQQLVQNQPANNDPVPYVVEPFVSHLSVPWSVVFTGADRLLVTERPGRIRVVEKGTLLPEPIRSFPEVSNNAEEGLMGMSLDPEYANNQFVYLCIAYQQGSERFNKVVRLTDAGATLENDFIVLDRIPTANFHAGCRLRFGPDTKLYITTGDARKPEAAQDKQSLAGKVLRINADGSIPSDNPVANSAVYSYGHRNPQGLDWNPVTGTLIVTEHGPSGNDGPGGGDEINVVKAGRNYGWPIVSHEQSKTGLEDPLLVFTPAIAPASGMFYRGSALPQFTNHFFVGMLKGKGVLQVAFDESGEKVETFEMLPGIDVGRVRDVIEGPDGYIYFTTSNSDGRGTPSAADDYIYRLVPRP